MTVKLVVVPDVILPDGTVRRGDLAAWLERKKAAGSPVYQIALFISTATGAMDRLRTEMRKQAVLVDRLKAQLEEVQS